MTYLLLEYRLAERHLERGSTLRGENLALARAAPQEVVERFTGQDPRVVQGP